MRERGTSVASTDLHIAATAVAEACSVARRVQAEVVRAGESVTKDDRSPVTVADLAVQLLVTLRLARDLPGDALLEFRIIPINRTETELHILSRFLPTGLGGIIYWYSLYPFHHWLFRGPAAPDRPRKAKISGRCTLEGYGWQ